MSQVDLILEQWGRERPDLDVASMGLLSRLKRIGRVVDRAMERTLAEHGLTVANFDVLATLRRSGPPFQLSPGELIANTLVTSGTMTHRVDQLVAGGQVERRRNPDDGRGFLIALTDEGRAIVDEAVTAHVATLDRLTEGLTESQRTRLDRLLRQYLEVLESPPDADDAAD